MSQRSRRRPSASTISRQGGIQDPQQRQQRPTATYIINLHERTCKEVTFLAAELATFAGLIDSGQLSRLALIVAQCARELDAQSQQLDCALWVAFDESGAR